MLQWNRTRVCPLHRYVSRDVRCSQQKLLTTKGIGKEGVVVKKKNPFRTPLVVQRLRLHAPIAGGLGLIPGEKTRSCMPRLKILYSATEIQRH